MMTPTADPELLRLLDIYADTVSRNATGLPAGRPRTKAGKAARSAILDHLTAHYIPRNATRGYQAARGVLPWRPGDELPEDAIRRLRDGEAARLRTLYADDTGAVVEGVADFEGDE